MKEALTSKILVIGVDGMDPKLTRKYLDEGKMPNVRYLLEHGAARHDLVMLGGHPPITPPMWTTLACGCYSNVHGITDFYRMDKEIGYDYNNYNLNSQNCKAEPLWNVFAEAGKKTLVFTWPGSSWPPTSSSPFLHVVDGTTPEMVNAGIAQVEPEFILAANVKTPELVFEPSIGMDANIPCVITDLEVSLEDKLAGEAVKAIGGVDLSEDLVVRKPPILGIPLYPKEVEGDLTNLPFDVVLSPIREPHGWASAPEGAREFAVLLSGGLIRRPALFLPNASGQYDHIAIYHHKSDAEPLVTLAVGEHQEDIIDDCIKDDQHYTASRMMMLMEADPDGNSLKLWVSAAMDIHNDFLWHPRSIYQQVCENVGYPKPMSLLGGKLIFDCLGPSWDINVQYQADVLNYLIKANDYDVVFSQVHNIDAEGHMAMQLMKTRSYSIWPEEKYQAFMEYVYCEQTDQYVGQFLHLLDEGWTILLVSDHAAVTSEHKRPFMQGYFYDLGYTILKRDADGQPLREIDWSQTKAIINGNHNIYINLKGRDPQGIVDPQDKYALEEEIMTALYGLRHPETGQRMIAVALRNKDAVLLGYGGPYCGDICFWTAEGYNMDHGDSLSTTLGYADTSVGPIFIAAGQGIKPGITTDRIIRQVDVAPTLAFLGGVRVPAQCEGAPVYQIMERY